MQALGPGRHQGQMGDPGNVVVPVDAAVQKFDLQGPGIPVVADGLDFAGHHINTLHD